jgi:hypothetical protein
MHDPQHAFAMDHLVMSRARTFRVAIFRVTGLARETAGKLARARLVHRE